MNDFEEYLINWAGDLFRTSVFPEDLATGEYKNHVHIIRLSDLTFYWEGDWYPIKEYKPTP